MKLAVLGSGSAGNCTYLATEKTVVLIDGGFGIKSLRRRLERAGLSLRNLAGIFLTHGHGDHVNGLKSLKRELEVPLFATAGTLDEAAGLVDGWVAEPVEAYQTVAIGDIEVTPFPVPHDAQQPVGFRFRADGIIGASVTDSGEINGEMESYLNGCDWLILESNYDENLLRLGPYPWSIKRRVLSDRGHLSNHDLAHFLKHRFDGSASHILLAHLSRQNNSPELAADCARQALEVPLPLFQNGPSLHLTHQLQPSIVLTL